MIREHLVAPTSEALAAFLTLHCRTQGVLVQVLAYAEISYRGRATSQAEAGHYLVLLKCDGSLQIHGPRGVKPINWQPRTDRVMSEVKEGYAVLTASRRSSEEVVTVTFLETHLAQALKLQEESGFVLDGSETQMQQTLARHPELIEPGLRVLDRELLVGVGDVDLYARDAQGRYVVVELKRAKATQDAVHQLARYVDAVRGQVQGQVRGILAAPSVTTPAFDWLVRLGLEYREVHALPAAMDEAAQPSLFGL